MATDGLRLAPITSDGHWLMYPLWSLIVQVPAQFRSAVEAGRVDELYSLLQVADVSLRASPGFKDLKKQLLAEAKQVADRRGSLERSVR